jgi:hypothetical protein
MSISPSKVNLRFSHDNVIGTVSANLHPRRVPHNAIRHWKQHVVPSWRNLLRRRSRRQHIVIPSPIVRRHGHRQLQQPLSLHHHNQQQIPSKREKKLEKLNTLANKLIHTNTAKV